MWHLTFHFFDGASGERDDVPGEQQSMARKTGCPFKRPLVPLHESGQGLPMRMLPPNDLTTPCGELPPSRWDENSLVEQHPSVKSSLCVE